MGNILSKTKQAIKSTLKWLKTNWVKVIAALVLIILLASVSVLGVIKYNDNKTISDRESKIENQESQINKLSEVLSQTEEGKKQLEAVNSSLKTDKAKLTNDNAALNDQVAKVNADLAAAQASLNQKNAQIAAANKCIALLGQIQTQVNNLNANIKAANIAWENMMKATTQAEFDKWYSKYVSASNAAQSNFKTIQSLSTKFKSGRC